MTVSPSTKKAIASSLLLGLAGLVALLRTSSAETSFIPSFRNLDGGDVSTLSAAFKPTGFYTSDIAFFTVKPWGPATWSVDFTTKSIKKLNSLLFSADGEKNEKGSILCTDELCQAHGKATTAVLTGEDGMVTASLEIGADAFEVCFTCPPGQFLTDLQITCMTDLPGDDADCFDRNAITTTPFDGTFRTNRIFFRDQEEPMPNIIQMTIKYTCEEQEEKGHY